MASVPTEMPIQQSLPPLPPEERPSVEHLIIEDGKPVDNLFQERQMRLLVQTLYESWPGPGPDRGFVAMANVGLFYSDVLPAIVPDVLLSIDVEPPTKITMEVKKKEELAYFTWKYGKVPDVVVEIVSNRKGGELAEKRQTYHRIRVTHYIVYDQWRRLGGEALQVLDWQPNDYRPAETNWLADVGLGLVLWVGRFEGYNGVWLRWCNQQGDLLPTGAERAEQEKQRADRLAEQLRRLGAEPEA